MVGGVRTYVGHGGTDMYQRTFPGHGRRTTSGGERNFLQQAFRRSDLCGRFDLYRPLLTLLPPFLTIFLPGGRHCWQP